MTQPPPPEMQTNGSDPALQPFLRAATAAESDEHLRRLLEEDAAPIFRRVLARKGAADPEDIASSSRAELIRQLALLRAGERAEPIKNFRGYAGAVAYAMWAEHLREAYPARAMLLNRLRYLLDNRTRRRGFALWVGQAGERWCGLEKWRERGNGEPSAKLQWLLLEPAAAAREALAGGEGQTMPLAELVASLLGWLSHPLLLRDLVEITGALLGISDRKEALEEMSIAQTIDPGPSPLEALKWTEYLRWLWLELGRLSLPQRVAFLLHATVVREFELQGIASMRQVAALLEMPAEMLAELWTKIPLGDLVIAARLGRERQQVINLRRVARDRLGLAWKEWIK